MKRKPSSKPYYTALYLYHVKGQRTFTSRDIHDAMPDARDWYHFMIPNHVIAERDRLLAEHDYPYTYNLLHIYHVWGGRMPILHAALIQLFKPYITIDEYYYLDNLTADQVSNCFKCGYIELIDTKPFRTYRIAPMYVDHTYFDWAQNETIDLED